MRHMHTRVWMSAAMALLVICLAGCPLPGSLEELYGYNTIVLRNEGSRPLLAFYIIDSDEPGRGVNYLSQYTEGLTPTNYLSISNFEHGSYRLEIEYELTPEEQGSEEAETLLVVEKLAINLTYGQSYTWYWYRPSDAVLAANQYVDDDDDE